MWNCSTKNYYYETLLKNLRFFKEIQEEENIADFIAALDIFVLPSNKPEPFGMVILEAMAMAKPVIASNIGGPVEIITDKHLGTLVPPRATEYMAKAIIELAGDGKKRDELGLAGKEHVRKSFNSETFRQRIEDLYEDILN